MTVSSLFAIAGAWSSVYFATLARCSSMSTVGPCFFFEQALAARVNASKAIETREVMASPSEGNRRGFGAGALGRARASRDDPVDRDPRPGTPVAGRPDGAAHHGRPFVPA